MIKTVVKAMLAGISISFGSIVYLSLENHVVGAVLFLVGLFTIYVFDYYLFTGKVCYIVNKPLSYLWFCLQIFAGNILGAMSMGYMVRGTKLAKLIDVVTVVVDKKLSDTLYSSFMMGILCGFLIGIAILGYATIKDEIGRYIALFLPIIVFILSGYEHCIANAFYFSFANAWSGTTVIYLVVVALGNTIGGMFIPFFARIIDGKKLGV